VFGLHYNPEPTYEFRPIYLDTEYWGDFAATYHMDKYAFPRFSPLVFADAHVGPVLQAAGRRMATRYSEASCHFIIELILLDRMETLDVQSPLRTIDEVDLEYIIEDLVKCHESLETQLNRKPFAAHTCLVVLEAKLNASNGLAQLLSCLRTFYIL